MQVNKKRILIFGAGVIGSTYGGLLAESGCEVTLFARNTRLKELQNIGLWLHKLNQKNARKISVEIISDLKSDDIYDYVFVALRKNQVLESLQVLKQNKSQNIVFMVNNPSGYEEWVNELGKERVIPAFPGSGGKIENGVVFYEIVSAIIQTTTIGELKGGYSSRILEFKALLKLAGFKVTISHNMDSWQKSHVAMVGPLGDVIYFAGGNNYTVAHNSIAIRQMNLALKENFNFLHNSGIGITPWKLNIFRILPLWLLNIIMKFVFNSKWAETVISNHALNAKDEMFIISNEFIELAKSKGFELEEFVKLISRELNQTRPVSNSQ